MAQVVLNPSALLTSQHPVMKSLVRSLFVVLTLLGLSSCVMPGDTFADPMPGSGGYYGGGGNSGFIGSGLCYGGGGFGGGGYGYNNGYGYGGGPFIGARGCPSCRRNPCICGNNRYFTGRSNSNNCDVHDHDDHNRSRSSSTGRSSSSRSSSSNDDQLFRYRGSVSRGDTKPVGNHTREWYKDRGYSLKNLEKVR
jgi:hypothetical protein